MAYIWNLNVLAPRAGGSPNRCDGESGDGVGAKAVEICTQGRLTISLKSFIKNFWT